MSTNRGKQPIPSNLQEIDTTLIAQRDAVSKLTIDIKIGKSRKTASVGAARRRIAQLLTKRREVEREGSKPEA